MAHSLRPLLAFAHTTASIKEDPIKEKRSASICMLSMIYITTNKTNKILIVLPIAQAELVGLSHDVIQEGFPGNLQQVPVLKNIYQLVF